MLILKLAWRSMLRHKRRSIITGGAVALSLALMLIFVGIGDDGHARMANLGIGMGAGNVLVQGRGYQKDQTLDHLVTDPARVIAAARGLDHVRAVVPRVRVSGLLSTGESSAPVMVSGVDPDLEPKVSEIAAPKRRLQGSYVRKRSEMEFSNQPADIYVGQELAKTLKLQLGDRTVLTVSPVAASRPAASAYIVRGIFKTGIDELDQAWVEVPIKEIQQQLNLGDRVTQVAVLLDDLDDTDPATAALGAALHDRDLEVLPWQVALRELHEAIVLDDAGLYLMMGIIFLIMTIGIFNTVLMSVVERTREFGVMMALGTRKGQLFGVVVTEALLLALIAATIGLGIGLGLHLLAATYGIDITSYAKDYEIAGIVMEGRIYSRLTAPTVLKWTIVVVALTFSSALYPAFRSTRLQPVEAIRHV